PTRAEIDGDGALDGRGLEIAYAKNLVDVYFMQVQGSGYVEFRNGERKLFAYDGTNKHPYRSIGRHMVDNNIIEAQFISMSRIKRYLNQHPNMRDSVLFHNPSYTFFTPQQSSPRGAGLVPLTSDYSIAVDPKYIPLGSCLLGWVPIINERGHLLRHEFRFLVAQDVGGAIKGAGHIDLYSGTGLEGRKKASYLHHYGKLWLLLPKELPPTI
ncbi:MAG: MltA domain-containing protein, partial [Bacteroidota bacterium]